MILPYLAIALLILVTVYSATVSFRQRPDATTHSWIFPNGVNRSAGGAVRLFAFASAISLLAGIGVAARITRGARNSNQRSLRFLIPENYKGWIRIEFEVPGEPPLPVEGYQIVARIPPSGLLKTSSPEQFGWARDSYLYYSPARDLRQLPNSGHGSLIWGKMNGAKSGSSGQGKYEEFFVGTEQEYKNQLKGDDSRSGP
jgi:hypothetical protein